MRSRIEFDLENVQRAAQLRRLGRDLHDQAATISTETAEVMSAVVSRIATNTDYGPLVAEGFSEAMITEAAVRHIATI